MYSPLKIWSKGNYNMLDNRETSLTTANSDSITPSINALDSLSTGIHLGKEVHFGLWHKGIVLDQPGAKADLLELSRKNEHGEYSYSMLIARTDDGNTYLLSNKADRVIYFQTVGKSPNNIRGHILRRNVLINDANLREISIGSTFNLVDSTSSSVTSIAFVESGHHTRNRRGLENSELLFQIITDEMSFENFPNGQKKVVTYSEFFTKQLKNRFVFYEKNGIYNIRSSAGPKAAIIVTVKKDELNLKSLGDIVKEVRGFPIHFIEADDYMISKHTNPHSKIINQIWNNFPDAGLRSLPKEDKTGENLVEPDQITLGILDSSVPQVQEILEMYPDSKICFKATGIICE